MNDHLPKIAGRPQVEKVPELDGERMAKLAGPFDASASRLQHVAGRTPEELDTMLAKAGIAVPAGFSFQKMTGRFGASVPGLKTAA